MTYIPLTLPVTALVAASITRPTGALTYAALNGTGQGAIISNASNSPLLTFAGAARAPLTGTIFGSKFTRAVQTTQAGIVFRAHMFLTNPALTVADNTVYQAAAANDGIYLGYLDHSIGIIGSNVTTFFALLPNGPIPYALPSGSSLFSVIEERGNSGYIATSAEVMTQTLTLSVD